MGYNLIRTQNVVLTLPYWGLIPKVEKKQHAEGTDPSYLTLLGIDTGSVSAICLRVFALPYPIGD